MNRQNEQNWLQAEREGQDLLAEEFFARAVAALPTRPAGSDFVAATSHAVWRARARRRLILRCAKTAAAILITAFTLGLMYEFQGFAEHLLASGTVALAHGLGWVLASAGGGIKYWMTASQIGDVLGDTLAAPTALLAAIAALMISLVAIFAFQQLTRNELGAHNSREAKT